MSLCLIKHCAMKAYRGLDGASSQLLPPSALPTAKNIQYPLRGSLGGFQIQSRSFGGGNGFQVFARKFCSLENFFMGRDSSVGIATRYGLDGPEIESLWGRDFPHPSRPALGSNQPPTQWLPGLSRGQSGGGGLGVDHPPTSIAEVKERVELYLYSLFGPSWSVVG